MDFEKVLDKELDKIIASKSQEINMLMGQLPEGELKEYFKSAMNEASDKKNPFDAQKFAQNVENMSKNASRDNTK